MKKRYIIAGGEDGSFGTLRDAKDDTFFYTDKEYDQIVGEYIVGYIGDEVISVTEIKPNRKFGRTLSPETIIKRTIKFLNNCGPSFPV